MATANTPNKNIINLNQEYEKRDILQLFSEYLTETFNYPDESVIEELNDDIIDLLETDQDFKKQLEETLYNNQEILTNQEYILEGKKQQPTVANWIKEFIKAGVIEQGLEFDQVRFFNQSNNFSKLTLPEKDLVAKLFDLYYRTKFFPQSVEKLPESEKQVLVYTKIPDQEKKQPVQKPEVLTNITEDDLVEIYNKTIASFPHLTEEKIALKERTANQLNLIYKEFQNAYQSNHIVLAMACLELMTENGQLIQIKNEAKIASPFKKDISKKMEPVEFKVFWNKGFGPEYLQRFLKWLMIDKNSLTENQAAVFALRLANIMKRHGENDFMKIAYGDLESQGFKFQN